jgi:hypothetical protein
MIHLLRIDHSGPSDLVDKHRLAAFIDELQFMLREVAEEINSEQGVLVIKIYDGKRLTYSFENISAKIASKINQLARPHF